jgi:hypothetical protein
VYLRGDDWVILAIVSSPGFAVNDLFLPYGNHIMPFSLAAFWACRAVFGATPWWPLVGLALVSNVIACYFTWRTIRLLVGPVRRAVVPLAVAAWGAPALAAAMWPAPAMYQCPLWAVTAAAIYVHVAGHLSGKPRHLLLILMVGAGLLVIETTLLVLPLLFLISAFWFGPRGAWNSILYAWHSARTLWLVGTALLAVYAALYLALGAYAATLPGQRPRVDLLIEGYLQALTKIVPAMLLGGPWMWREGIAPVMAVPTGLVLLTAAMAWALIVRWGLRVWGPVIAMVVITVTALSAARLATFGSAAVLNPYYYIGVLGLTAITLAVSVLPNRLPRQQRSEPARAVFAGAAVLLLIGAGVTASGYARSVPSLPSRDYLAAVSTSLEQPVLNTQAPREAFGVFSYAPPFDNAENLMALAGISGEWVRSTDAPHILDDGGHRIAADFDGDAAEVPSGCQPLTPALVVPLPTSREPVWSVFAMAYRSEQATRAQIGNGLSTFEIELMAGEHTVYFTGPALQDTIRVAADSGCLRSLAVGRLLPKEP